jgi:hypothetical protein
MMTRLAAESVHISYLPSLWKATGGYRLEHAVDTDAPDGGDYDASKPVLCEHSTICDYHRYFHMRTGMRHSRSTLTLFRAVGETRPNPHAPTLVLCARTNAVHTNIIGNEKRLGPVCVSIQKELKDMEPPEDHNEAQPKTPATYRALIRTVQVRVLHCSKPLAVSACSP